MNKKRKVTKQIVSWLLCLAMVLTTINLPAFVTDTKADGKDDIVYESYTVSVENIDGNDVFVVEGGNIDDANRRKQQVSWGIDKVIRWIADDAKAQNKGADIDFKNVDAPTGMTLDPSRTYRDFGGYEGEAHFIFRGTLTSSGSEISYSVPGSLYIYGNIETYGETEFASDNLEVHIMDGASINANVVNVKNGATLYMHGGSITNPGTNVSDYSSSALTIWAGSCFFMEDGTVENKWVRTVSGTYDMYGIEIKDGGNATISGGTVKATSTVSNTYDKDCSVFGFAGKGQLTLEGVVDIQVSASSSKITNIASIYGYSSVSTIDATAVTEFKRDFVIMLAGNSTLNTVSQKYVWMKGSPANIELIKNNVVLKVKYSTEVVRSNKLIVNNGLLFTEPEFSISKFTSGNISSATISSAGAGAYSVSYVVDGNDKTVSFAADENENLTDILSQLSFSDNDNELELTFDDASNFAEAMDVDLGVDSKVTLHGTNNSIVTFVGTGKAVSDMNTAGYRCNTYAEITLNGGTVSNDTEPVIKLSYATLIVQDGTVIEATGADNNAFNQLYDEHTIFKEETIVIHGGIIRAKADAINMTSVWGAGGTIKIDGGEIISENGAAVVLTECDHFSINGGTLSGYTYDVMIKEIDRNFNIYKTRIITGTLGFDSINMGSCDDITIDMTKAFINPETPLEITVDANTDNKTVFKLDKDNEVNIYRNTTIKYPGGKGAYMAIDNSAYYKAESIEKSLMVFRTLSEIEGYRYYENVQSTEPIETVYYHRYPSVWVNSNPDFVRWIVQGYTACEWSGNLNHCGAVTNVYGYYSNSGYVEEPISSTQDSVDIVVHTDFPKAYYYFTDSSVDIGTDADFLASNPIAVEVVDGTATIHVTGLMANRVYYYYIRPAIDMNSFYGDMIKGNVKTDRITIVPDELPEVWGTYGTKNSELYKPNFIMYNGGKIDGDLYYSGDAPDDILEVGTTTELEYTFKPTLSSRYKDITVKVVPTINPIVLKPMLTGTVTKEYDGTTNVPEENNLEITLTGDILGTDEVTATGTFAYEKSDVGTGVYVVASDVVLIGAKSGNYKLSDTTIGSFVGNITKATYADPVEPTIASSDCQSVTLNAVAGCEYSIDGTNWQDSPTFTKLAANTEYTFYQRMKADDNHNGSDVRSAKLTSSAHDIIVQEAVEATCTEAGLTEGRYCSVCEEVFATQEVIEALGHTEVVDEAVEATCTEAGITEGKHCLVCNEVLVAQEMIEALGHTEVVDEAVEATCTEAGITEGKHCLVCNEVLVAQEMIEALGHTEVVDEAVEATCTEVGITEGKHCLVCNEVLVAQEEVEALGHNFVNNTCTNCGLVNRNGLIYDTDNWYYYVDGEVDTAKTDIVYHYDGWYYIENGALNKEYAGLVDHTGTLWYVSNGKLDKTFKGLVEYEGQLMFVKDGKFAASTGVWTENGLKYWVVNGLIDTSIAGLKYVDNTWTYFKEGIEDKTTKGLVWANNAWWYVSNGTIDKTYNSLVWFGNAWWYVKNGTLDKAYAGLVEYSGKLWYVTNGKLDKTFAGTVEYAGESYTVANGIGTLA